MKSALQACNFPGWTLNRLEQKFDQQQHDNTNSSSNSRDHQTTNNNNSSNTTSRNISVVVPYIQGLEEKFKKTCKNRGTQVHFRSTNRVRTLLMASNGKDHMLQKSGIIYNFRCPHINCSEQYIGESSRTLGDRLKEHLRAPSAIHHHISTTGHQISTDCFKIIHREHQCVTRNTKDAMKIRVNYPSLKRNIGKYQLPHIWDQMLQDTPTLQLR